jgi:hypothetical protein
MNNNSLALYEELDAMFSMKGFEKEADPNLELVDCYYIDADRNKYVFVCKVFTRKSDLFGQFEYCQDVDISYLQGKVFTNQDIRWDMYFLIFYIGDEELSYKEYNRIEKDRFFCKKLIITAKNVEDMKQELNRKLPVTGSYYNFDELSKTGVEQSFFEIFRRMAGLDKKIFPDEYLQNISDGDMSDFIKKLAI